MADYDLIVIGAGPGGYVAAIRAAQLGMKVAIAERDEVGGVCLNRGCIPTKTFMHTARAMRELQHSDAIGLHVGSVSLDIARVYARKNEVVSQLRGGVEELLKAGGITLLRGDARIEAPCLVTVGGVSYRAGKILIATGGRPVKLPLPGMDLPGVLTSDDVLGAEGDLPHKLVIIGGGVIGVEFATIYSAFGCCVTIVEAMDRLLPGMDREISQNLQMILKRRGVAVYTSAALERITKVEDGLACHFSVREKPETILCDRVLVSVGRRPDTEGLLADGIYLAQERGAIPVDERYETCVKGIYAAGDVTKGGIRLAHAASAQGINAVSIMCGAAPPINMNVVPSCVYTDPEIASVGLGADEAKKAGASVKIGKFLMSANGKNLIEMADRGFVKLVFDQETEALLGAQLMCPRATDLIGELSVAIGNGLTLEQLSGVMRAHPTFGEAIAEAVEDAKGRAIHILPRKR